jgi:DNA repair ATPase RecN
MRDKIQSLLNSLIDLRSQTAELDKVGDALAVAKSRLSQIEKVLSERALKLGGDPGAKVKEVLDLDQMIAEKTDEIARLRDRIDELQAEAATLAAANEAARGSIGEMRARISLQ